jgi:hypothetical protein
VRSSALTSGLAGGMIKFQPSMAQLLRGVQDASANSSCGQQTDASAGPNSSYRAPLPKASCPNYRGSAVEQPHMEIQSILPGENEKRDCLLVSALLFHPYELRYQRLMQVKLNGICHARPSIAII